MKGSLNLKNENIINAVIVGCGRIAKKHFDAINSIGASTAKILAVSDLRIDKCAKLVGNRNDIVQTTNFKAETVLSECNLGIILTESGNHFQHAVEFLNRSIDVLIEKPVTLKLEDADELERIAIANNCKVYVVKQNRYNPPITLARRTFENGDLGSLNIGTIRVRWCRKQDYYDQANWRGTWAMDGGVIANQASHHVDLLRWFLGPVKSLRAHASAYGVKIETEDTVVAFIEFESGALGTLEATTCARPRNLEGSLSLIGSKGSIEVGGFAVNELIKLDTENSEFLSKGNNDMLQDTKDVYGSGHLKVYEEIVKDRCGLDNTAVMLAEARNSLELIHMIYKSIEENRTVYSSEEDLRSIKLGI